MSTKKAAKGRTIGLLTGGGDCPGLNPAIKGVVYSAHRHGIKVVGFMDGYEGLIKSRYKILTAEIVRTIDRSGGTILGSTRTKPFKTQETLKKSLNTIERLGLRALICIGGEDTLGQTLKFYKEYGVPTIGIPKTIDKDLSATEYTLGFESAIEEIVRGVDKLRTTAGSHRRVFCVETMGRHAGFLALIGGIASGAYITLIPEVDFSMEKVCNLISKRKRMRYSLIVAAEGAKPLNENGELDRFKEFKKNVKDIFKKHGTDEYGHNQMGDVVGHYIAMRIEEETGLETRCVVLSHLQRGGAPCAKDRRMGLEFGYAAIEAYLRKGFGNMVSARDHRIVLVPLEEAVGSYNLVDVEAMYDTERYRKSEKVLYQSYI